MIRLGYLYVEESVNEDVEVYMFIPVVGDQKGFDRRPVTRIRRKIEGWCW